MRSAFASLAVVALTLGSTVVNPVRAAEETNWKLVVVQFSEQELFLIKTKTEDGKTTAEVSKAVSPQLGSVKVTEFEQKGEDVKLSLTLQGKTTFTGSLAKDGVIYGALKLPGAVIPARLEKGDELKQSAPSPLMAKLLPILQDRTAAPKDRYTKLAEILHDADGPGLSMIFAQAISAGSAAEIPLDQVKVQVDKWLAVSKPYGSAVANDIRLQAVKAIGSKPAYASLAFELALEAEKNLGSDATSEAKADILSILAKSAKAVGKEDIAKSKGEELAKLETVLDAEYHEKVPPFKPTPFSGRADKKANKVVLMEIFTGAQCPPCVASDVGFDALLTTFKPTEFIGLQYHLHIPGPDPLTNDDTEARQKYYGDEVRGTPSTFFNGKSEAGGGGGMDRSEVKYSEFKEIIEKALAETKDTSIDLSATLAGEEIKIEAKASTDSKEKDAKPTLRLVLVEESVKYTGGNKLRFHHNVVRAFPGGTKGLALNGGGAKQSVSIKLADVRKAQEEYLSNFEKSKTGFPNPLPPIKLEGLSVVAFVQDDADRSIWHAVSIPVTEAKP